MADAPPSAGLVPARHWWLAAYAVVVALAVWVAWPLAGKDAPILLAIGLPTALASSSLRREPIFARWLLMALPTALVLWQLASGHPLNGGSVIAAAIGAAVYFLFVPDHLKVAKPLTGLALMVALVAYFSSGRGGAGPMMDWYLRFGLTEEQAHALTLGFRKTVHFTFYGTVGWTSYKSAYAAGAKPPEAIRTGLLAAFAVAAFDEVRQSGYANRSGSAWDVLLDVTGAAVFVGLSEWRRSKGR